MGGLFVWKKVPHWGRKSAKIENATENLHLFPQTQQEIAGAPPSVPAK